MAVDARASAADFSRHLDYEKRINRLLGEDLLLRGENGLAIELCGQPLFLPHATIRRIALAAELVGQALEKSVASIACDRRYRPHFRQQEKFSAINKIERAYDRSLYLSRFDFRLSQTGAPLFIEFNTSCPAMVVFFAKWRSLVLENYPFRDLSTQLGQFVLDDKFAFPEDLIDCARTYYGKRNRTLSVAIANDNANLTAELDYMAHLFELLGHEAEVTSLDKLSSKEATLQGPACRPIDLMYCKTWPIKSIGSGWQAAQLDAYRDFLSEYMLDAVCSMNPFPAMTIGEDKALVALLRQGCFDALLNEDERGAVREYLPFTALLGLMSDADFGKVTEQKDSLVLKPRQEMRGHFVAHGKEFSSRRWRDLLAERRGTDVWIVQEFVPAMGQTIPGERNRRAAHIPVGETLTAFLLRGRCVGILSRVSETLVNNLHSGGAVQCVVAGDETEA
jgi:hypothetical protein